jgi:hypothetical protein
MTSGEFQCFVILDNLLSSGSYRSHYEISDRATFKLCGSVLLAMKLMGAMAREIVSPIRRFPAE